MARVSSGNNEVLKTVLLGSLPECPNQLRHQDCVFRDHEGVDFSKMPLVLFFAVQTGMSIDLAGDVGNVEIPLGDLMEMLPFWIHRGVKCCPVVTHPGRPPCTWPSRRVR